MSAPYLIFLYPSSGPPYQVCPYVDTTGWLLYIPIVVASTSGGGATTPNTIVTPPTFVLNGTTLSGGNVPTALFFNAGLSCFVYQMANQIQPADVLTMAAASGWATAGSGSAVGGTSGGGTGSAPLTVQNNSGKNLETALSLPPASTGAPVNVPTMKLGYSKETIGPLAFCLSANMAKLMESWFGPLSYDANLYPATITQGGTVYSVLIANDSVANGIDSTYFPTTALGIGSSTGVFILTYDDATTGVSSGNPKLTVALAINAGSGAGFTCVQTATLSAGTWDGTAIRGISSQWLVTKTGAGTNCIVEVTVKSSENSGGVGLVGLQNLIVLGPGNSSYTGPTQIDANTLRMIQTSYSSRFILGGGQCGYATSSAVNPADLSLRTLNKYIWSAAETLTPQISAIGPVSFPFTCESDQYTSLTWANIGQLGVGFYFLVTTVTPHGFSTGNYVYTSSSWPATAQWPAISGSYTVAWTLASAITSTTQTTISLTPTSGSSAITSGLAAFGGSIGLQIGSEQMTCSGGALSTGTGTVVRGANGTTASTYSAGTSVLVTAKPSGLPSFAFVVDQYNFVFNMYVGSAASSAGCTAAGTVTYSSGSYPSMHSDFPLTSGTAYEMCASICGQLASRNGQHVMFVPLGIAVTDAFVTALFNEQIIPYINSDTLVMAVLNNELWNTGASGTAATWIGNLYQVVPNPYTGGTGFNNSEEYGAARQTQITTAARAAMVAAGLPGTNVLNYYGSGMNQGSVTTDILQFLQKYELPLDVMAYAFYCNIGSGVAALATLFNSWIATFGQTLARALSISYCRSSFFWQGQAGSSCGVQMASNGASLRQFNHGTIIGTSGNAWANTGTGRAIYYEMSPQNLVPIGMTNAGAWMTDMIYDPKWYWAETAFLNACQIAGYYFATTMPSSTFNAGSNYIEAVPLFGSLETLFGAIAGNGTQIYSAYVHPSQLAGPGDGSDGQPANQFSWAASGSMTAYHYANESVRGYAHQKWMAAANPQPSPHSRRRWIPQMGRLSRQRRYG